MDIQQRRLDPDAERPPVGVEQLDESGRDGAETRECRRALPLRKTGHDLEKAMAGADAEATRDPDKEEDAEIRWINPYYAGKELEYIVEGAAGRMISVPDVSYLLGAAEKLHNHLDWQFHVEARAGKP
jgi:hypothetical protein